MITLTSHEKTEWARFAQAAYARGDNATGHRFSAAASLPIGAQMTVLRFDSLQNDYRAWLTFNEFPICNAFGIQTFEQARNLIPADAELGSTFGYPGEGGYVEYWRRGAEVWTISNGRYDAMQPFDWSAERRA